MNVRIRKSGTNQLSPNKNFVCPYTKILQINLENKFK